MSMHTAQSEVLGEEKSGISRNAASRSASGAGQRASSLSPFGPLYRSIVQPGFLAAGHVGKCRNHPGAEVRPTAYAASLDCLCNNENLLELGWLGAIAIAYRVKSDEG